MRANERSDERVTQYLRLYSWLIQITVPWRARARAQRLSLVGDVADAEVTDVTPKARIFWPRWGSIPTRNFLSLSHPLQQSFLLSFFFSLFLMFFRSSLSLSSRFIPFFH